MAVPVTISGLTKRFGDTVAVAGVDLSIAAGELFFLLGPSGCGKTTLLRMLAGFTDPSSGTIRFGERDVTHLPPEKRHTGMCFQSYALWPHLSVQDNVAFGLKLRKTAKEEITRRVGAALELVQMGPYAQRKPNELSGGQQQRVALARALVIEPDLLLLDEPLSNLDAKLRLEMRGQIRRICKEAGITAVYVTHDQKEALSMADRMAVLQQGRVMQVGDPRAMYQRPGSKFVADFLGETNFVAAQVREVNDGRAVLETAVGTLTSTALPAELSVGEKVTCSIRPEAVHVAASGPDPSAAGNGTALNRLAGRRVESVYLGETAQHQVAMTDALRWKVYELNPRVTTTTMTTTTPAPAPGAEVALTLAVAAEDVVVVRE